MQDRHLLERIDACRPGSADLQEPELAPLAGEVAVAGEARELYERVGAWDRAIGEALEDVRVPGGLSDRLLARLAAEQAAVSSPACAESDVSLAPSTSSATRRNWLRWSIGLAAASKRCCSPNRSSPILAGFWRNCGPLITR